MDDYGVVNKNKSPPLMPEAIRIKGFIPKTITASALEQIEIVRRFI